MRLIAQAVVLALLVVPLLCSVIQAQDGFQGVDINDGFAPQWYPADAIFKRQNNTPNCGRTSHSCLDVNGTVCCANHQYCIVNRLGNTRCCPLGNSCQQETSCTFDTYECNATTTRTTGTVTSTSTYSACCPRGCSTSSFRCPQDMGNGCCAYGEVCATSACLKSPTSVLSGFIPQATTECSSNQVTCPSSLGGGCCERGRTCTVVESNAMCGVAPPNITPTSAPSPSPEPVQGGGMSTAEKAGIAVGVVIGAAIIIGVITWMCIRKRRRGTTVTQTMSQTATSRRSGRNSIPLIIGGGGHGQHSMAGAGSDRGAMSVPASEGGGRGIGSTADYFGPDAVVGPYTDTDVGSLQTRRTTPGHDRGVPLDPMSPSHIVAPVELDPDSSRSKSVSTGNLSPGSRQSYLDARSQLHLTTPPIAESTEGRYELYGSTHGPAQLGPDGPPQETPYESYLTPLETPGNYAGQGPLGHQQGGQRQEKGKDQFQGDVM
ncbi:hypothetical protein MCOR02_006099 [Pyricularia oryzae]|uniref:Uncharacterized protein n=2 Tax=Pyricularia TaxID=48558 RepID=A0ABQ8NG07_PYRGI|nr:hypothetical protein MCOR01_007327 [Pyricularia oryzae]KAI6296446.1 hypothetical protein MCOR33_006939 [Pyricularia grisea]KAH9434072.1 hypothetical protein MCOR02_006099 [Pyricularia oryzae]KAI6254861.1 hypothetical protein MCOR19_008656 [Pyricularia oryzae]KAI6266823.1 hypothetical protein MCOR26_009983 [Pyricularia oryzae]